MSQGPLGALLCGVEGPLLGGAGRRTLRLVPVLQTVLDLLAKDVDADVGGHPLLSLEESQVRRTQPRRRGREGRNGARRADRMLTCVASLDDGGEQVPLCVAQ